MTLPQSARGPTDTATLFSPGSTWVMPSAFVWLGPRRLAALLARHLAGDWGDVCPLRARANALALQQGYRLISEYAVSGGRVYVVTEDDRTGTLVFAVPAC